ncbi:MAG: amidase, partial [Chitinophagales bacterium]
MKTQILTYFKITSTLFTCILLLFSCQSNTPKMENSNTFNTSETEKLFDLSLTQSERDTMQADLEEQLQAYKALHKYSIGNEIPPALQFNPIPLGFEISNKQETIDWNLEEKVELPENTKDLAFYPVHKLAVLIKNQKITSEELTRLYIERLKQYGDTLQCVITLTEELAIQQARKADAEIKAGKYRGPLHGIPYGAKDLLAVEGFKTTWGATPYKEQEIKATATVVQKLEEAGAVLVAKLTLGALAWGDVWYGGTTKNPWNLEQGSSGSSAGSAAATSAGLVAFAIGTETHGSIVSPSTRCRVSGLRPTYGRVSRHGAMALSWSMDKVGPICRSAKDCALVFEVIRGMDKNDPTLFEADFNYKPIADLSKLKVGYFKNLFEEDYSNKENDQASLEV